MTDAELDQLKELQKEFGFDPDRVVAMAKEVLGKNQ
jgi:hypothetical protein